jgi:F-type H+-transporting ATPase subunit epsilon
MNAPFHCTVVSPERPLFEGSADKVVVPGTKGQIGVLPRHAPIIAKLEPGVIRIHRPVEDGGDVARMAVAGGFLQVVGTEVTLLVTDAVTAADIDEPTVRREMAEVVEKLQHPPSDEEFQRLLARRRSLQAQLAVLGAAD